MVRIRRTWLLNAAISSCGAATVFTPINWQWSSTMPDGHHGNCPRLRPAQFHTAAALSVPAAGLYPTGFYSCTLLMAADGRRLSKRDRDLDLGFLRQHFVSPQPLIGLLAFLAGLLPAPEPVSAKELLPLFSWQKVPHNNIIVRCKSFLNLFKL